MAPRYPAKAHCHWLDGYFDAALEFLIYCVRCNKRLYITSLFITLQVAEERLSNVRTVRAFGRERYEIEKYNDKIDKVLQVSYAESLANAAFFGLTGV